MQKIELNFTDSATGEVFNGHGRLLVSRRITDTWSKSVAGIYETETPAGFLFVLRAGDDDLKFEKFDSLGRLESWIRATIRHDLEGPGNNLRFPLMGLLRDAAHNDPAFQEICNGLAELEKTIQDRQSKVFLPGYREV